MKLWNSLFVVILILMNHTFTTFAGETKVQGLITKDSTWSDTIVLTGPVQLEGNSTLTVKPGTVVISEGSQYIQIEGNIIVKGTKDEMVTFTCRDADGSYNDTSSWRGIMIDPNGKGNTDSTIIEYAIIERVKKVVNNAPFDNGAINISNCEKIRISHCEIKNNKCIDGGALSFSNSSGIITDNYIQDNESTKSGGGIDLHTSSLLIKNNIFKHNLADFVGGAITMFSARVGTLVKGNSFYSNKASYRGGAISIHVSSKVTIANNLFTYNKSTFKAGALLCEGYELDLINNIFFKNSSGDKGGAVYVFDTDLLSANNTIAYNTSGTENPYDAYAFSSDTATIVNTIFWKNYCEGEIRNFDPSNPNTVKNCLIDQTTIDTLSLDDSNFDGDPLFTNINKDSKSPDAKDFRLKDKSPCINKGTVDTAGLSLPELDCSGQKRIRGDIVDIGANENQVISILSSFHKINNAHRVFFNGNSLTIDISNNYLQKEYTVNIYTLQGRLVERIPFTAQKKFTTISLNTPLSNGYYMIEIPVLGVYDIVKR